MIDISQMTDEEYENYLDANYKWDIVVKIDDMQFIKDYLNLNKDSIINMISIKPIKDGYNLSLNLNIIK